MEKQAQQTARSEQPETRSSLPAQRQEDSQRQAQCAARAAAVLRLGGRGAMLRPADALALGAQVGNSALGALVQGPPRRTVEPFRYQQSPQLPEAYPIAAKAPALFRGALAPGTLDMESYPAAALGGDWAAGLGDWTGGADGQLSS